MLPLFSRDDTIFNLVSRSKLVLRVVMDVIVELLL